MVDPDLIDDNLLAQQGLAFLAESQILVKQKQRLLERLASGDSNEKDEILLERIKEYRIQMGFIETLSELGEQFRRKESDNESR